MRVDNYGLATKIFKIWQIDQDPNSFPFYPLAKVTTDSRLLFEKPEFNPIKMQMFDWTN